MSRLRHGVGAATEAAVDPLREPGGRPLSGASPPRGRLGSARTVYVALGAATTTTDRALTANTIRCSRFAPSESSTTGLMRQGPLSGCCGIHRCLTVVQVGQVSVVGGAQETDVAEAVITSHAERVPVVELEPMPFRAATSLSVDESATASVARDDGASYGRRDAARGRCRGRGRKGLAWSSGLREVPGLETLELIGDRTLEDRGEIAVRDFRAHERSEPFELVPQRGAGRELDLVASRGKGHHCGGRGQSRR